MHKTLEAAPRHQISNDVYFFILQASLDSVPKELKGWKILIQNLMFLKLIETLGRESHISVIFMCFGGFKNLQHNHPFVC